MDILLDRILGWIYAASLNVIILVIVLSIVLTSFISSFRIKIFSGCYTICMLLSVLTILYTTVLSRLDTYCCELSLFPFWGIFHSGEAMRMYIMNAFLFFPYGLFLPHALPERAKHPVRITIISALFFSLIIETIQLIFRLGTCETDDVIMNTLGAAIGSLSFILSNCLQKWKEKRKVKST